MGDRTGEQFGNYRLVRLLGQGGYAQVYLGQHLRLNQQAAIKVLHAHLTQSEAEHFQREAQTISTLVHPSIIRVFDYDVQDGVPFLVMDYAPNGSLRQSYRRGMPVPLPQITAAVKQVADALQYAHEQKFIHRDVKPENMLLGRREEVLLSDFGLAALAHSSASLSTQEAIGTLSYMAPEQIEGHPRPASDQYALAVVVYEWLCGQRPFEGSATEVMVQQLTLPPPPLHEKVATISLEVEQVVLRALAKDPKERFASVHDFATALEQASLLAFSPTAQSVPEVLASTAFVAVAAPACELAHTVETPPGVARGAATPPTSPDGVISDVPLAASPAEVPLSLAPTLPVRHKRLARLRAALLIGLVVLVVAGSILGSLSLLAHLGLPGAQSSATAPVRGGTWTDDIQVDPDSFIPYGGTNTFAAVVDQALYLPLFYGDAQGVIHPGAASEVPTAQNGGISTDAKTWTFHLRPGLVWSDGQPYDARDVDFTWRLWKSPKFNGGNPVMDLISSAQVSADHLSITFHLMQAFAPFLDRTSWVDGFQAPLPAHHFSRMAPDQILKSPDNLNPKVVSGPFMMSQSVPGDHYTLVRNPRYYRAREGLPYLDKVVFRIGPDAIEQDLQAGTVTSVWPLDVSQGPVHQQLTHYTLVMSPTTANFEGMYFNFHNVVLASHPEVRQAMAMAIDHQALIQVARHGLATPLCTDHGSFYLPGYEASAPCSPFEPAVAIKLLSDDGWVKGPDSVRSKNGQRLEFEYSTTAGSGWRSDIEAILERNFQAIGIKLDIQNYPAQFFRSFLAGGKASPPTGALAGRYDIAEFADNFGYDPDDSYKLTCDGTANIDFYCNPALDTLYQQELTTADPGLRQQLFYQIHAIYLTDFPFIVLFGSPDIAMVRKGVHNYQISPVEGETVNISEWWCDNGKC